MLLLTLAGTVSWMAREITRRFARAGENAEPGRVLKLLLCVALHARQAAAMRMALAATARVSAAQWRAQREPGISRQGGDSLVPKSAVFFCGTRTSCCLAALVTLARFLHIRGRYAGGHRNECIKFSLSDGLLINVEDDGRMSLHAARPALPRSWVVFSSLPPIFERHFLRVQTISADSNCGAPLRLPLPPAARIFNTPVSVAAGSLSVMDSADGGLTWNYIETAASDNSSWIANAMPKARPAPFASRSVRRALLMPHANPGSLYRCGRSN